MRVAIIGYGFVGKALEFGIKDSVKTFKVDPKLGTEISDLVDFKPNVCFICVPTPMNDDGSQDTDILQKVIDDLISNSISSLMILKSTVLPNSVKKIKKIFPGLVLNPEFLRERYANEDFINSKLIVLGGSKESTKLAADFYRNYTKCITTNYKCTDLVSAALIKYSINTFLALKVTFFNQLHDIFSESNPSMNWEDFVDIISTDERIGHSHMKVPGVDNKYGYGGPCFPKDCFALIAYSEDIGKPFELLKKSSEINNKIRNQYKELSKREIEQNINYNLNK